MKRVLNSLFGIGILMICAWSGEASSHANMSTIPGGTFVPFFSESPPENAQPPKTPEQPVSVSAYYLDHYPVTNAEFLKFLKVQPDWRRSQIRAIYADASYLKDWKSDMNYGGEANSQRPVVHVSWFAARAYCKWLGKDLPTVNQWEFAGRPEAYEQSEQVNSFILEWYGKPAPKSIPNVGSTFKNKYGIWDLHGLIWEWTLDFNSIMISAESSNTCGTNAQGTSDAKNYAGFMRYAFRNSLNANYTTANLGFRCASERPPI